jgi:hypothetical protein
LKQSRSRFSNKNNKTRKKNQRKGCELTVKTIIALLLSAAGLALLLIGGLLKPPATLRIPENQALQLSGDAAQHYLHESRGGQSLMQAVTAARFGLKAHERSPFDAQSGAGYLAMSHDQNLSAWFSEDGVTVRPTLPEANRDQVWKMELRLKAYGYGKELADVPPVTSREVKGNRVEYLRQDQRTASDLSNRKLIEWYENQSGGIEQGFTLSARPERGGGVGAQEPLRLRVAVTGDLRALTKDEGQMIELSKSCGETVLSYSKLIALDANGKKLAARMEASADGGEIALVVEDKEAVYPVAIDPIAASLEKKLDAGGNRQTDARFGFSVAIDGDTAVVGAWREDVPFSALVDAGAVYTFTRSGSVWDSGTLLYIGTAANASCGWSVAVSRDRVVFGCPGENSQSGKVYRFVLGSGGSPEAFWSGFPGAQTGYSVGISASTEGPAIIVASPFHYQGSATPGAGIAYLWTVNPDNSLTARLTLDGAPYGPNANLGTDVAISGNNWVVGVPGASQNGSSTGAGPGIALVGDLHTPQFFANVLEPSDGAPGDRFGQSVAISGKTVVVGAWGDDDKGAESGSAYVFVGNQNGGWSPQQKLTASDGRAGDHFSENAVAIEGNTIVVGADEQDGFSSSPDPNRGEVYIYMRSGTVWTQQTSIMGEVAADNFGISVGISDDTVIVGARAATASGVARAGAAYVYRLGCTPPSGSAVANSTPTACPGAPVTFGATATYFGSGSPITFQWRKDGVNIPGATDATYAINAVTASDAGSYDVILSNACGNDISTSATLAVHRFILNPTSQNFGVSGSNGVVNITATGSNCPWTAVSNDPFINVTSGASGSGSGTVGFTVAANPDPGQRTGTVTIAGITFTVSQDGTSCGYSIAPTSQNLGPSASTNSVNVTAGAGCAWTATSNAPSFLEINSGASGSGNGTVSYTVAANSSAAQRMGTLTLAGQTFTVTQAGAGSTLFGNISTRLRVLSGDNALIGGMIATGTAPKRVIIRAIGPSLIPFGVPGTLENPTLELFQGSTLLFSNDDWNNSTQQAEIAASGLAPSNNLESAIIWTLTPGQGYTAVVRGKDGTTGVGVVEAFDLDQAAASKLGNISTRGFVDVDDNVMIAGLIVSPSNGTSTKVLVRALGPTLGDFGVPNALANPTLDLVNSSGTVIRSNDNWKDDAQQRALLEAAGLAPSHDEEAALVETIAPGAYTAIVRGSNGTTGVGLVEAYNIP